jgi:hypothetical protein
MAEETNSELKKQGRKIWYEYDEVALGVTGIKFPLCTM